MSVHQFLFGYQNGHRLIAGSTQLEESLLWTLLRETDRPSTSSKDLEGGIIFGIPLDEELYALCRTWNAREIERPGAVWTHVILLPSNTVSPLRYIDCFCNPGSLSKHEFSAPLDVREFEYDWSNARLDKESAHFLLAIAARPRSKLRVLCESHPIQILKSVGHLWGGLLAGVPFSTSLAKRSVRENKRSVIISDYLSLEFKDIDKFEALSSPNSIQSARIERSWQLLDRDPTKLGDWLALAKSGFEQTTSNLKLALEALLLGRNELDDDKLLERLSKAVNNTSNNFMLGYCFGISDEWHQSPEPWITALHLLGKEDWGNWRHVATSELVGEHAAHAPSQPLAHRLTHLANTPEVDSALRTLAKVITTSEIQKLFNESVDAAGVLIEHEPKLVYVLHDSQMIESRQPAKSSDTDTGPRLGYELSVYSWTPFFWKPSVAGRILHSFSNDDFARYAAELIDSGSWKYQDPDVKALLLSIPNLLERAMQFGNPRKVIQTAIDELPIRDIQRGIASIVELSDQRITDGIAEGIVDYYGPLSEIPVLGDKRYEVAPMFLAHLLEARWRRDQSSKVISRIKSDLKKSGQRKEVLSGVEDKDLLRSLNPPSKKHASKLSR